MKRYDVKLIDHETGKEICSWTIGSESAGDDFTVGNVIQDFSSEYSGMWKGTNVTQIDLQERIADIIFEKEGRPKDVNVELFKKYYNH